jgi:hypothetical protein
MNPVEQARSLELLARLLREHDCEAVIHPLLASCLHGPAGFAALLPHLPADLLTSRARMVAAARRASCDLGEAADALDLAALSLRHSDGRCAAGCSCRDVREEGEQAFLSRTVSRAAMVLSASDEPYYQNVGDLLQRRIAGITAPERVAGKPALNLGVAPRASAA